MINLIGLNKESLIEKLVSLGEKPFRAKQIFGWIYGRGTTSFDDMGYDAKK